MAIIGYARCSTQDQDLRTQRTRLSEAGCTKLFEEKESGARGDRPELAAMLTYVRDGDVVVVTKLDRLARSMVHFWATWEKLQAKGVSLRVLDMHGLDTATPHGQLLMGVLASVAQFERVLIRERQSEGIKAAKAKGVYRGRQPIPADKQKRIRELVALGVPKARIAKQLAIGRTTVYQYLEGAM
jgi:DNA invertase Pin-like site-specific DNA recombinase